MKNNKVISILGKPGAGKTTIAQYLKDHIDNSIYFEFGNFYRAITKYLFYDLNLSDKEIEILINHKPELLSKIPVDFTIGENQTYFTINNNSYSKEELFNEDMDKKTVYVGGLLKDTYNKYLAQIIDSIKSEKNVIINSRRPKETYPDLDQIIYLDASFEERAKRKAIQNNMDYKKSVEELLKRDLKEKRNGFNNIDNTEITVIDTNDKNIEEVFCEVMKELDEPINKRNLTLILKSYKCDKNCPFCIAKMNNRFKEEPDNIDNIDKILNTLDGYNYKFKRFVISGNGEPSQYSNEDFSKILDEISKHKNMFETLRIHSSGNIFLENEKIEKIKETDMKTEILVSRISLDDSIDQKILGYKTNYFELESFKQMENISLDVLLTKYLDIENIKIDLEKFLNKSQNIKKVRFKALVENSEKDSVYKSWVKDARISKEDFENVKSKFEEYKNIGEYKIEDTIIEFTNQNGNYKEDYVINGGQLKNYNEEKIKIGEIVNEKSKLYPRKYRKEQKKEESKFELSR